MFKKILRDILLLFCFVALAASTSQSFMKYIWAARDSDKWWGDNQLRGGNLAGISDLAFLKKFHSAVNNHLKRPVYNGPKNISFYLLGDSYTWSLRDTNFAGISDFHFINRYNGGGYHLDTTKKNILMIAVTEVWVRRYFRSLRMIDEVYDSTIKKKNTTYISYQSMPNEKIVSFLPEISINDIFNKNINQNLQCNLFNYNIIMPLFQYKAAINYYLFDRASGDVIISKDKNFLFLKTSVSWTDTGSSYVPLMPGEKNLLINNLNTIYDHYRESGFAEVYLSIIPNTASVMQPEGYNNLIPLIQNDSRLKMKIIDVYYTFKGSSQDLFYHGDSHWNLEGKQMWVDKVNKILTNNNNQNQCAVQ